MPSARRRIAIIITTLILGALPAMAPAALLFFGSTDTPGAGLVAVACWVAIGAGLLAMLTPLFTDMRLPIRSALRTSALGLVAGAMVGWPIGMVIHPTAGIITGLITGSWVAQRDLGRHLGAVSQSLRDDLRAMVMVLPLRRRNPPTERAPRITPAGAEAPAAPAPPIAPPAPLIEDDGIGRRRGDG